MNINSVETLNKTLETSQSKSSITNGNSNDFSKELSNIKEIEKNEIDEKKDVKTSEQVSNGETDVKDVVKTVEQVSNGEIDIKDVVKTVEQVSNGEIDIKDDIKSEEHVFDGEMNAIEFDFNNLALHQDKKLNNAINGLEETVDTLNRLNNKIEKKEGEVVSNDINVGELNPQIMPQMNGGMNFNSDNQQFSDLMQQNHKTETLNNNVNDLAEEKDILSTMDENIAMANKNILQANIKIDKKQNDIVNDIKNDLIIEEIEAKPIEELKIKTVQTNEGIKKVDKEKNITVEVVAKFDEIIVSRNDVEFFTQLVNEGNVDMNSFVGDSAKASQVSKTLADLLAKAMNENQPIRINFDNDISVIIRISRDGKISADFLPSSQIAETYLKENLPLLKQRFDENNIDYDELNQRKQQKQEEKGNNRKKGNKDE